MSRSVDDLLSAGDDYGGLKEAESLSDILARTYEPPPTGKPTLCSHPLTLLDR